MVEKKKGRGGARPGSGRPRTERNNLISIRISDEAKEILNKKKNKTAWIDELIRENG